MQMGHATAEAVVRAGLQLVPYSFTGESEGMAVESIGVSGIPVELILPEARQQAMERVQSEFPGVLIIDYTLPSAVNGAHCWRPYKSHIVVCHVSFMSHCCCCSLSVHGCHWHFNRNDPPSKTRHGDNVCTY
jgi:hypothetical protein